MGDTYMYVFFKDFYFFWQFEVSLLILYLQVLYQLHLKILTLKYA